MHLLASVFILLALLSLVGMLALWPREGRSDRLLVLVLGLAARAGVAAAVSAWLAATNADALFPDERLYLAEARGIQAGGGFSPRGYSNLLGVLFEATGRSAWFPRFMNVILGAALGVIVYEAARRFLDRRTARVAGVVTALWPSLVLWSSVVLKDSIILLGVAAAFAGAIPLFRGRWSGTPVTIVGLAVVGWQRPYVFVVASVALAVTLGLQALLTADRRTLLPAATVVLAVGVLGLQYGVGFLGVGFIGSQTGAQNIINTRVGLAGDDTSFVPTRSEIDESDSLSSLVVRGVPSGLFYSVLGPLPWQGGSALSKAFLLVEIPLWWAALAFAVRAAWRLRWRPLLSSWAYPLIFAGGIVVVLSLFEGNAGTALRQRALIFPVLFALAAYASAGHPAVALPESHQPSRRRKTSSVRSVQSA